MAKYLTDEERQERKNKRIIRDRKNRNARLFLLNRIKSLAAARKLGAASFTQEFEKRKALNPEALIASTENQLHEADSSKDLSRSTLSSLREKENLGLTKLDIPPSEAEKIFWKKTKTKSK